jgi:hypothetical protein
MPALSQIPRILNKKNVEDSWMTAKLSKYNDNEVFIQYWYYETVEDCLKIMEEEDAYEIVSFLKDNGKTKVLKRIYCFINLLTRTVEIYRGPDRKAYDIVKILEKLLNIKLSPVKLDSEKLRKVYSRYALELQQAMFRNIDGLIYDILKGDGLENNQRFNKYLQSFPECLRAISFKPKIKFLNGDSKYQIAINGDKGTIRISSNNSFQWRPRFEIRQIVFIISEVAGLLSS